MFKHFNKFQRILVTGPQRSGTRIATRMIAKDTDFLYVDEVEYHTHDEQQFAEIVNCQTRGFVVQCPAMMHIIHKFSRKDTAIVVMLRNPVDILASQARINWEGNKCELRKYKRKDGVACEVKYAYWLIHQRGKVQNLFEIKYDILKHHPLWVNKAERADFTPTQWRE